MSFLECFRQFQREDCGLTLKRFQLMTNRSDLVKEIEGSNVNDHGDVMNRPQLQHTERRNRNPTGSLHHRYFTQAARSRILFWENSDCLAKPSELIEMSFHVRLPKRQK